MVTSGKDLFRWSLFVDTDSLYLHTRQTFGITARMDYLRLPLKIIQNSTNIDFFHEKMALVMRLGKDWQIFSDSLKRFGYDTVPADRGMQPITIGTKVMSLMNFCNGVVIVTSSNKVLPLIKQIKDFGGLVKVVSFSKDVLLEEQNIEALDVDIILMNQEWLWKKGGVEERR